MPHSYHRKPKLVVLLTHPIQYYAPTYRCLAQRGKIDIQLVYLSDAGAKAYIDPGFARTVQWDVPLLNGYAYTVLQPGSTVTSRGFWQRHDAKLATALQEARPDWLLVYGYASRMNWVATRWARRHGVKTAYTSDSNSRNPERLVPLKKLVVGHYFHRVDTFLAPSERNVEYLMRYHAPPSRIHRIPFAIDVARFTPAHGITAPRRYDFVWAGKFTARKRAIDFLDALVIVARAAGHPVTACIAGDGPQRDELRARARRLPTNCQVTFTGFVNQRDMPAFLQSARIFVFTSEHEPYGLAATEAAAAGLALIVASDVGCVGATVIAQAGVNALTYRARDVPALACVMEKVLCEPALRGQMQQASLEIARHHDAAHAAEVIEHVVSAGGR